MTTRGELYRQVLDEEKRLRESVRHYGAALEWIEQNHPDGIVLVARALAETSIVAPKVVPREPKPEASHPNGFCESCSRDENHPVYHLD